MCDEGGKKRDWCVMKGEEERLVCDEREDTLVIWRLITVSGLLS